MATGPEIFVLGGSAVGKTALVIKYLTGKIPEQYDPTIEDRYVTTVKIKDNDVTFVITDTVGEEEYESIKDDFIRRGDGFVLVMAANWHNSINEVTRLAHRIRTIREDNPPPAIVVLNKDDMEENREVSTRQLEEIANAFNYDFYEISAVTGNNLQLIFLDICEKSCNWRGNLDVMAIEKKKCSIS